MREAGDALAASALVLAILAAFLSVWMPEIAAALAEKADANKKNNGPLRDRLAAILRTRLYPLLGATLATVLILAQRGICILFSPLTCAPQAQCHYDDVQALMLLTIILLVLLCAALLAQIGSVRARLGEI